MDAPEAVTWLLLDVGGVLEVVDDDLWPKRFASRWADELNLTTADFSRRLARADLPDAARRTGVADRYWSLVGHALGATAAQVAAMRADFWNAYCGTADKELFFFLAQLKGRVDLAILSNSADGAREEEEGRFRFSAVFNPICYSHEIGVLKPDPAAFLIACARMDAHPSQVLFIDDRMENIEAAVRLGLHAHLHVNTSSTIDAIRRTLRSSPRIPEG